MKKLLILILLAVPVWLAGQTIINPFTGQIDFNGGVTKSWVDGGVAYFVVGGDTISSDTIYLGGSFEARMGNVEDSIPVHREEIDAEKDSTITHRGLIDLNYGWIYDILNDSLPDIRTAIGLKANIASPTFSGTVRLGTDTLATREYARSVGGTGSGDLAYADTVSGTGFIETQFRADTAKENIRGEIAAIEVGEAQMVYPESQGIAIMGAATWGTSITDNSTNWNTAYGWGDHGSEGYMLAADFPDSINEYFSDAVVAVAVEDSGTVYYTPRQADSLVTATLAEYTPSNLDIDSLAAVVTAQGDSITDLRTEISNLWDALATLGAGDLIPLRFSSASVRNDTLWITWDKSDVNTDSIVNVANVVLTEDDVTFGITSIIYESDSILVAKLDSASAYGSVYLVDHVRENGYPQLQDTSGNKTANFTDRAVTNLNSDPLADNTAPVFQSAFTYSDSIIAAVANENFHQDSIPPVGSITVTEDATTFGIAGVTISGDTLFIAGDSTFLYGTAILWDYDNSTYPQLQDSAENVVASLTDSTVTNTLPDLSNMIVNGTFADSSYWERREGFVGWTISGGVATYNDVITGIIEQPDSVMTASVQPSTAYTLTFDLTGTSGGGLYMKLTSCDDGEGSVDYTSLAERTTGSITIQFTTPADIRDGGIAIYASADGDSGGSIDNLVLTAD